MPFWYSGSGLFRQPSRLSPLVMAGLVPGIHVLTANNKEDVDGRDKPGHDERVR
jgi:hypothetical protein